MQHNSKQVWTPVTLLHSFLEKYTCNIFICLQKHSQHHKDEWTRFFRKICLSLYSKGLRKGYRVRGELETGQNCNILTPSSSSHSSASFSFSWAAQPGAWGPSLCWDLVLTPWTGTLTSNSDLQLPDFLLHPGYVIVWCPPASCECHICTQFNLSTVKVIPWYIRLDAPVIYTGAFLIWQLGRVGGQYITHLGKVWTPLCTLAVG